MDRLQWSFKSSVMKKHIILFSFICFHVTLYGQVITGTILEKNTDYPIQNALVYFNGTSVGTYTDQNGSFKLDISKFKSMPLTISALGYFSVTLNDFLTDKPLLIYLPLKVFELNEVNISARHFAKSRKRDINIFKEIFLGTTQNARNCEIINENDIMIFHKNDTIEASSLKPILINNRAFGYNISYYLDKFEFIKESRIYLFTGNVIFSEDSTTENRQKQIFEKRRTAYTGSKMHFFRALWENKLDSAGFMVENEKNEKLDYYSLVIQKDTSLNEVSVKYLKSNGVLSISYFKNIQKSFITFRKDSVCFYRNGNFDGLGITWEGKMERQRIGDMLPYDYSSMLRKP